MKSTFEPLSIVLWVPVRRRQNKLAPPGGTGLRDQLKQAIRIASKAPEVMVRISGKARGARHVQCHLQYITREGALVAEDECGQLVVGRQMVGDVADLWMGGAEHRRRSNSRDTVNVVLSMPHGTDREKLLKAARRFAYATFATEHAYLLVQHNDTDHPHCHLTVRSLSFNGQRLDPRKRDLQAWREDFAQACRDVGLAAEASPRRTRGVVRKAKSPAVWHADKARRSRVQKAKVAEAIRTIHSPDTEAPWTHAIATRQRQIRAGWEATAREIERSGLAETIALANRVRAFVQQMPPMETERQQLKRKVLDHLKQQRIDNDGLATNPDRSTETPER